VVTLAVDADGARSLMVRVAGIYEPTPDPMRFTAQRLEAHMHLPDLVALVADSADPAARELASAINVKLIDPHDAGAFASELAARAPARSCGPRAGLETTIRCRAGSVSCGNLRRHRPRRHRLPAGADGHSREERRDTIAILRLIGISRRSLLTAVAIEGLLIAVMGAVFGVIVAVATESLVNRVFQARYDTALVFVRVTLPIAVRSIAIALPLGLAPASAHRGRSCAARSCRCSAMTSSGCVEDDEALSRTRGARGHRRGHHRRAAQHIRDDRRPRDGSSIRPDRAARR